MNSSLSLGSISKTIILEDEEYNRVAVQEEPYRAHIKGIPNQEKIHQATRSEATKIYRK